MRSHPRLVGGAVGAVGTLLVAIGIVYLTVACQNLPGVLGPTPGETSPRTPLGATVLVLGLVAVVFALLTVRRRPPRP